MPMGTAMDPTQFEWYAPPQLRDPRRVAKAAYVVERARWPRAKQRMALIAVAVYLVAAGVLVIGVPDRGLHVALLMSPVLLCARHVGLPRSSWNIERSLRASPDARAPFRCQCNEHGVRIWTPTSDLHLRWAKFTGAREANEFVMLALGATTLTVLPTAGLVTDVPPAEIVARINGWIAAAHVSALPVAAPGFSAA